MTFLNNWFAADAAEHVADLRQRRGRRGEERHRLQPRQPRRRAVARRGAARPAGAARRDLPRGGHALLRQPVHRPRHRVGRRRREGGGRGCSRTFVQQPENQAEGAGVRVPAEQPVRPARRPDRRRPTASTRPSRRPSCEVPSPEVLVGILDVVGRAAQGGPGAARARHLRLDGRAGRRRARPGSTSPRRRRSAPSTSSRTTDEVGLWVFSTDLGGADPNVRELVPVGADRRAAGRPRRADRRPVPDQRHAAVRGHREGLRVDGRRRTTRRRSTPSCCSPTARTTTATPATTTSSSPT